MRQLFDDGWYAQTFLTSDAEVLEPWAHYQTHGRSRGHDPAPWFSTVDYLDTYPDLREAGVEAFRHYVQTGRHEGRRISMSRHVTMLIDVGSRDADLTGRQAQRHNESRRRIGKKPRKQAPDWHGLASKLVDEHFYMAMNPDVGDSGLSATEHFMTWGWREHRDPAPWFSTSFYLKCNPDIIHADVNPLVHYLAMGRREGRLPEDPLGFRREVTMSRRGIETESLNWLMSTPAHLLSESALTARIRSALTVLDVGSTAVIVGSDDYLSGVGGVQACVATDAAEMLTQDIASLYIFPAQPLPILSEVDDPIVSVRLLDELLGLVRVSTLTGALRQLKQETNVIGTLTIHGLLGHNIPSLMGLVGESEWQFDRVVFWAHDYFAACSNYNLSPTGVDFCGAPVVSSSRCRVCPHGDIRVRHALQFDALLELDCLAVVAPSASAALDWRTATSYKGHIEVRPIGTIEWKGDREWVQPKPLRLAFIGFPVPHKGWWKFQEIHRWAVSEPSLELLHFGATSVELPGVMSIEVAQTGGTTDAMIEALREHEVDVVLHWPSWPETFGITAHEALAAGAVVLTNHQAGNVTALAEEHSQVLVVDDEELSHLLRRRHLVPWLKSAIRNGTKWGAFELSGVSVVAETVRSEAGVRR